MAMCYTDCFYGQELTVKDTISLIYNEVSKMWTMTSISMLHKRHVHAQIVKLYQNNRLLQKSKKRRNVLHVTRDERFNESLNDLFEVVHSEALQIINNEEVKCFLINQR